MAAQVEEVRSFEDLKREVIDTGFCCLCGACAATCPVHAISLLERPYMLGSCEMCGLCYAHCPQTGSIEDPELARSLHGGHYVEGIGCFRDIYRARSRIPEIKAKAYKGGVATTLLAYLMDKNVIDAAVVTHATSYWEAYPHVAVTREEIIESAGTKYTSSPIVDGLARAVLEMHKQKVAIVGVPCHIRAVRKMMYSDKGYLKLAHAVSFMVGLFCMETMHYERLLKFLWSKGVRVGDIGKFEVSKGFFIVTGKDGNELMKVTVKELEECMNECKKNCGDFAAEMADVSIGAVGSPEGWSTVIVRTKVGEMVFKGALEDGYIEAVHLFEDQIKLEAVVKLALSKKKIRVRGEPEIDVPPTAIA